MTKKKISFGFAPTADPHDRFFNCYPGSILHAVAPLIDEINKGKIGLEYSPLLFHPKVFSGSTIDDFMGIIERENPSIVALSSTYDSWHVALKLSRAMRKNKPSITIIHGGPHLDEVLEPWVQKKMPHLNPFDSEIGSLIDFAVGGDGEYSLLQLARDISAYGPDETKRRALGGTYQRIPGNGNIAFRMDDDVHHIRFSNQMDLNQIPHVPRNLLPAASLFDFDCFRDIQGKRLETVTMISHRGCKYRCDFCSEGLPYQARSMDNILAEARTLKDMGVKAIFFDDSSIQDNDKHMQMFSELHKLGFTMGALSRLDMLQDHQQVDELKKNGITYLYVSIEQYDDHALNSMHKRLSTDQIDRGLDNLARAGIQVGISTLFGLPYETASSVQRTIDYVQQRVDAGNIQYVSMSLFSYHPRTPSGNSNKDRLNQLDFNSGPPNLHDPFTGFEEGTWYHPDHVTEDYARNILVQANEKFGRRLVRNIGLHRGKNG
jgi:radical SAM superfamily enzyme YgiQ (UPF0313 family)